MWLGDPRSFGGHVDNDGFDDFENTKTSMWPEVDFSAFKDDDFFEPIDNPGNSGSKINAIGAELKKNHNGNISPFPDSVSDESDSNRWEPASLWRGNGLKNNVYLYAY